MDWPLRRAGEGDAPACALIAAASFLEAFAGILARDDIVAHCAAKSSPAVFAGWSNDPATVVTLAEHPAGGAPVGYSVLTGCDLPLEVDAADVELRRIYTLSLANGTGLGHRLMAQARADAAALGKRRLLLGVLATNARARAFYEREGFVLAGERRFLVGAEWHDDVIYARTL